MANSRRGGAVPLPRSGLRGRVHKKHHNRGERRHEVGRRREFFVPSFSVRRPVLATEEVKDFHSWLTSYFKRSPYEASDIGYLGLLLVEQKGLIGVFHKADVQPEARDVLSVAENIRSGLQNQLKSKPRSLPFVTGGIYAFGQNTNKIAVVPNGWKGYRSRYAKKNEIGEHLMNAQLVTESSIAIGGIANAFTRGIDSFGEESKIDTSQLYARTPHVTIGEKKRGGKISADEIADLNGNISEHLPDKLPLYDPIIHLRLQPERGSVFYDEAGTPNEYAPSMFIRNPKMREYGHMLLSHYTELESDTIS